MMAARGKIFSGIMYSWLRFVIGFIVSFVQIPLYFKYLSSEIVGIWFLFFSVAAFVQISDLGLPSAVSRAVAFIKDGKAPNEQFEVKFYTNYQVNDIYHSAFTSFIILSSTIVFIGAFLILIFKPGFGLPEVYNSEISIALILFLLGVLFNMTANIPNACLSGLGDVGYDNLFRIVVQLIGLLLIFVFLKLYSSILVLASIYLIQGLMSTIFVHVFLRIRHRMLFKKRGKYSLPLIKHMYRESIPLFINQIGSWLANQSGIWVATLLLGTSRIADYSIIMQLTFYGFAISMSIPNAINPFATAAYSAGGIEGVHKFFFLTLKFTTFILGVWLIILVVWGQNVLDLWIGPGHFLGFSVLVPILLNVLFELQHSVCGGFVWNTGKWPFVPATVSSGILNLVLCGIGGYYWGFSGIALGTMTAKLLTINWYAIYYALKRLKISLKSFMSNYFLKVIGLIGLLVPVAFLIDHFLAFDSFDFTIRGISGSTLVSLIFGAILVLLIWMIGYYYLVLVHKEREQVKIMIFNIIHGKRH